MTGPAKAVTTVAVILAASASIASSCDTEPSADTPAAEDVTASEFGGMSVPEQGDVIEKFYDSHTDECANVDLSGSSTEFEERIRTAANGAADDDPMSDVLLSFCE